LSLHHSHPDWPTAYPASATMNTNLFAGGKATGVWRLPPTPSSEKDEEWMDL
jgi:hypothetical protein